MRRVAWLMAVGVGGCMSDPATIYNKFPKEALDVGSLLGDDDVASTGDTPGDVPAVPPCACLPPAGTWYRFTQLEVTKLSNAVELVPQSLNLLWSKDIANLELNIMFRLEGEESGAMKLAAFSGARVRPATEADPSTICFREASQFDTSLPIAGCKYGPAEGVSLVVYGGTLDNPKNCVPENKAEHAIPVSNVRLAAIHTGNCSDNPDENYLEGQLTGVIPKDLLDILCTCSKDSSDDCGPPDSSYPADFSGACKGCADSYSSLHGLLILLNDGKDISYECTTDDGQPAACLEAKFRASVVPGSPATCGE